MKDYEIFLMEIIALDISSNWEPPRTKTLLEEEEDEESPEENWDYEELNFDD